jgi:hypothetical protein
MGQGASCELLHEVDGDDSEVTGIRKILHNDGLRFLDKACHHLQHMDEDEVFERMSRDTDMWIPLISIIDMWILVTMLNGLYYRSAHIPLTKQKIGAAQFLLLNMERSRSILKIWNRAILFSQILESNVTQLESCLHAE